MVNFKAKSLRTYRFIYLEYAYPIALMFIESEGQVILNDVLLSDLPSVHWSKLDSLFLGVRMNLLDKNSHLAHASIKESRNILTLMVNSLETGL